MTEILLYQSKVVLPQFKEGILKQEKKNWRNNARDYSEEWADGRAALDNLDVTWGQMSNAFYYQTYQYTLNELHCPNQGDLGNGLELPDFEQEPIDLSECYYTPVTHTVTTRIPEKTDLVVTPQYAIWSKGQDPNDQIVNFLYDDTGADGGYNHFEIRRMNRAYTLDDVFQAGEITPPMDEVRDWFQTAVFPPGGNQ